MSPPRSLRLLLGTLCVLAVLAVLVSNWNWARPAVVHYLRHTSQRDVQIDGLDLSLDRQWRPVVQLRGVRVANAPWAGPRPFVVAREIDFTFEWASLWHPPRIVHELRLVDADVDLQRQADGLRNWRLTRPDDRGPARMRIERLVAERSRLQLLHQGVGLAVQVSSTPLSQPVDGLTQRLEFRGELHGAPYAGTADAGPVLSMVDTGERFPVRGHAQAGDTRLDVDGRIADLMQLSQVDVTLALQGPSLAQLQAFLPRTPWPGSAPYRFETRLVRQDRSWAGEAAHLRIGRSELTGQGRYTPAAGARPRLEAQLASPLLRLQDLPTRSPHPRDKTPGTPPPRTATRVLPDTPLPLDSLQRLNADVSLRAERVQLPTVPELRGLQLRGRIEQGLLEVDLSHGQLAGASLQGRATIDTRPAVPKAHLDLRANGLRLPELWAPLARQRGVQWPALQVRATLHGQGRSAAAWLASLSGEAALLAQPGGSLTRRLDAKLGLDAGGLLRSVVQGDDALPIRCGTVTVSFEHGQGRTRQLLLETGRTRLQGEASVHLADETWALLLTPQPLGRMPLSLHASVLAQGTFRGFSYRIAQREPLPAASCADPARAG